MKKHKTVVEFLRCAKRILVTKGWARGTYARSKNGKQVEIMSRSAANFCMLGAMLRCDGDSLSPSPLYREARLVMGIVVPCGDVAHFNDTLAKSKSQVLKKYDEAIALASRG